MITIPTKIGLELPSFILAVFIICFYNDILLRNWSALIFPIVLFILILALCFSIKYSIDGDFFRVKNSIFGITKIDVKEIYKIEKTWNLLSSPAPSITGRVEIYYKNNSIVISPKNFEELKKELLKINPNITIKA